MNFKPTWMRSPQTAPTNGNSKDKHHLLRKTESSGTPAKRYCAPSADWAFVCMSVCMCSECRHQPNDEGHERSESQRWRRSIHGGRVQSTEHQQQQEQTGVKLHLPAVTKHTHTHKQPVTHFFYLKCFPLAERTSYSPYSYILNIIYMCYINVHPRCPSDCVVDDSVSGNKTEMLNMTDTRLLIKCLKGIKGTDRHPKRWKVTKYIYPSTELKNNFDIRYFSRLVSEYLLLFFCFISF